MNTENTEFTNESVVNSTITQKLSVKLGQNEKKFMVDTFKKSIGIFSLMGVVTAGVVLLVTKIITSSNEYAATTCSSIFFVSIFLSLWAQMRSWKWKSNIMNNIETTKNYVNLTYFLLLFSNVLFFGFGIPIIGTLASIKDYWQVGLVGVIFATAMVGFSIPAVIGALLIKRQQAITIKKLLSWIGFIYLAITMVVILGVIVGSLSDSGINVYRNLTFVLSTVFTFLLPIITCYQMSEVCQTINYENTEEVDKWKRFFVFEILQRLIEIVWWIIRLLSRGIKR